MPAAGDATRAPVVLKIGGSLAETDALAPLMLGLSAKRPAPLLVVPGGGTFADTVRDAQMRHRLSDAASHHMALLAMHQYGVMLADLAAGFALAETRAQFEAAWRAELVPIWLPAAMVLAAGDLPPSWAISSDSLAAWVAGRIGASRLLVVKSCPLPAQRGDASALAAAGIVDAAFAAHVDGRRFSWEVVSGAQAALEALG